jgi:lipoprotein-anchoring transpeptidase ErfK/SrfK
MATDDGIGTLPAGERSRIVGTRSEYLVRKGDSLVRIGARLGVDWRQLARINGIEPSRTLRVGQVLYYDNHRIVPKRVKDGIVINIPDRTLYLFRGGRVWKSYPVAVGRPRKPKDDELWMTPTGRFTITAKEKDPTWRVPPSIQEEMERKGEDVVTEVPPGDDNPLGKYALRTTLPGILIHGTISPASIYSFSSHGCIRVSPANMEELFQAVSVRTPGEIVYQPVKLLVSQSGRVFLEVHRDIYDIYRGDLQAVAQRLIRRENVAGRVDWTLVSRALRRSSGIPEEVTRDATGRQPAADTSGTLFRHNRSGSPTGS